jgi:hypothetical protein
MTGLLLFIWELVELIIGIILLCSFLVALGAVKVYNHLRENPRWFGKRKR